MEPLPGHRRRAGDALSIEAVTNFTEKVSAAQSMAVGAIDPKDIVFWWPNIIERLKRENSNRMPDPLERLRATLIAEMQTLLESKEPWIQLSGAFSLAKLGTSDIATVVDSALRGNPQWLANDPLLKWLLKLRNGSASYPNGLVLNQRDCK